MERNPRFKTLDLKLQDEVKCVLVTVSINMLVFSNVWNEAPLGLRSLSSLSPSVPTHSNPFVLPSEGNSTIRALFLIRVSITDIEEAMCFVLSRPL